MVQAMLAVISATTGRCPVTTSTIGRTIYFHSSSFAASIACSKAGTRRRQQRTNGLMNFLMRIAQAVVPKSASLLGFVLIRSVFAQPDGASRQAQWCCVAHGFRDRFPWLAALMNQMKDDVLAYLTVPRGERDVARSRRPA
jgi:hypothetical protein